MLSAGLSQKLSTLIHSEFKHLTSKNSTLSLRRFAKLIGISPATLSGILTGNRPISRKTARKFLTRFSLGDVDSEIRAEIFAAAPTRKLSDEEQIHQLIHETLVIWNRHDPKELASTYHKDGSLIEPWDGIIFNGRTAIERFYRRVHTTHLKDAVLTIRAKSIFFAGTSGAFIDFAARIDNMHREGHRDPVSLDFTMASFAVKKRGVWLFQCNRPYVHMDSTLRPWKKAPVDH